MSGYITTVETDGRQKELYRQGLLFDPRSETGFISMVRRANGEIWCGSSYGVLRLRPKTGGDYTAQWFLPLK